MDFTRDELAMISNIIQLYAPLHSSVRASILEKLETMKSTVNTSNDEVN